MEHGPLLTAELIALYEVTQTAAGNAKVARALPNGDVLYGIARALTDERGNFNSETDVRDRHLWVTSSGGMEFFWPISELVAEYSRGEFARYDW